MYPVNVCNTPSGMFLKNPLIYMMQTKENILGLKLQKNYIPLSFYQQLFCERWEIKTLSARCLAVLSLHLFSVPACWILSIQVLVYSQLGLVLCSGSKAWLI